MVKHLFTKLIGTRFQRELKRIRPLVDAIHTHEARLKDLSDAELQAQTARFRGIQNRVEIGLHDRSPQSHGHMPAPERRTFR